MTGAVSFRRWLGYAPTMVARVSPGSAAAAPCFAAHKVEHFLRNPGAGSFRRLLGSRFTATRSYVQTQELLRNRYEHLGLTILISKAPRFNAYQILRELAGADARSDEAF